VETNAFNWQIHVTPHNHTAATHLNKKKTFLLPLEICSFAYEKPASDHYFLVDATFNNFKLSCHGVIPYFFFFFSFINFQFLMDSKSL
jgi:hypothetical protein